MNQDMLLSNPLLVAKLCHGAGTANALGEASQSRLTGLKINQMMLIRP